MKPQLRVGSATLLLVSLLAGRPAAQAREHWIRVDSSSSAVTLLDSASVTVDNAGLVEVRRKFAYFRPQEQERDVFDSRVDRLRIDCRSGRTMLLATRRYLGTTQISRSSVTAAKRRWGSSSDTPVLQAACRIAGRHPSGLPR